MSVAPEAVGIGADIAWEALGLDPRLLRAVQRRELGPPTPVQAGGRAVDEIEELDLRRFTENRPG